MGVENRVVADANAVVDFIRNDRPDPPPLKELSQVFLPLPVVGELFAGAHYSDRVSENLSKVEEVIQRWTVLAADVATARIYGQLRGSLVRLSTSRMNDLWIAALCIQHHLPLLTNDRGFDSIPDLRVIHW